MTGNREEHSGWRSSWCTVLEAPGGKTYLGGREPRCHKKGRGAYSMGDGSHGRTLSRSRGFGGSDPRGRSIVKRFYWDSGLKMVVNLRRPAVFGMRTSVLA